MRKKVVLLFGGKSSEHDVSCMSCKNIYNHLDKTLFTVSCVYINQENKFYEAPSCDINLCHEIVDIISYLKRFDIVFPVLHGSYGEDGMLQGMLDFFEIPYVGSKRLASALGMDKVKSKLLAEQVHIPVVPYEIVSSFVDIKKIEALGYPLIVKPVHGGSSVGVSLVEHRKSLKKAIREAQKYDNQVLIEKYINGRELECAVLEEKKGCIFEVGEILSTHPFYDYHAKYQEDTKISVNPELDNAIKKQIQDYAQKIFEVIGAKDLARIDFFYDGEIVYFNEINTLPGFTESSMYPQLFQKKYSYSKLLTKLLRNY